LKNDRSEIETERLEIEIKTERLLEMMTAENLAGVLINSQADFAWLTGGRSNAINASTDAGACFLFVRRSDRRRFVLANNIEMPRLLAEEISGEDFEPVQFAWEEEKRGGGDFILEKAKTLLEKKGEIASDLFLAPALRTIENKIAPCRYSLTAREIERYRRLGKDAGSVLGTIFERIAPGETEMEIARKVKDALAAFDIAPVVALVGADERIEKFRHPTPAASKVWEKILLIAVCARREGLIANLSRIFCVGRVPDELKRKTEAVGFVFASLCAATNPGATGAELYRAARETYERKGFAGEILRHHQGGATGYKTRDWTAHPASREKVYLNQAFAWNPTVAGTKAEETFLRTEKGIETLTASPGFPRIPVRIGEKTFFSPGILSL
jgi:antitoxin VapB